MAGYAEIELRINDRQLISIFYVSKNATTTLSGEYSIKAFNLVQDRKDTYVYQSNNLKDPKQVKTVNVIENQNKHLAAAFRAKRDITMPSVAIYACSDDS